MASTLLLSLKKKVDVMFALLSMTAVSAGAAIADVTIDACAAENSMSHLSLAADIQSLCAFCSSIGQLVGFTISGFIVHQIGPKVLESFSYVAVTRNASFGLWPR